MSVTTATHLSFRGAAREVLDFYRSVFGGRMVVVAHQDAGAVQNGSEVDWVMWGEGRRQRFPCDGLRRSLAVALRSGRGLVLCLGAR